MQCVELAHIKNVKLTINSEFHTHSNDEKQTHTQTIFINQIVSICTKKIYIIEASIFNHGLSTCSP